MSKKISVDPNFLKVRTSSLKKSKTKFNSQQNISMNRIRKRILNQLNKKSSRRENVKTQNKPQKKEADTEIEPVINGDKRIIDNFTDSMEYLNKETKTFSKQKFNTQNKVVPTEKNSLNVKHTKPKTTPIFENVNLELPDELKEHPITINSSVPITQEGGRLNKTLKNNEPKYGCLKKGTKPTFSKHYNKTIKNRIQFSTDLERTEPETCQQNIEAKLKSHHVSSNVDMSDVTEEITTGDNINITESQKPEESFEMKTKSLINTITETKPNSVLESNTETNEASKTDSTTEQREIKTIGNKKQSGKKRKEILGKNRQTSKVSLIINNNKTRRKIKQEHMVLNTTPISYIKKVLKEKGLLEVGSRAPEDVLRSMYTNAKLSGDIENRNGEVLINNYMNDDSIVV